MMKPGDYCQVRMRGQEEWIGAEVAIHGASGEALAIYLIADLPEEDVNNFAIVPRDGVARITLFLFFFTEEQVWKDAVSNAEYEVLVTA